MQSKEEGDEKGKGDAGVWFLFLISCASIVISVCKLERTFQVLLIGRQVQTSCRLVRKGWEGPFRLGSGDTLIDGRVTSV